jgi:hypothetical protein
MKPMHRGKTTSLFDHLVGAGEEVGSTLRPRACLGIGNRIEESNFDLTDKAN